ncbi:hypothetical protein BJ138DRAFT_1143462 [Hygrophoropsis aurantiaca]|uniref:Uncharacterized protein n=1 Tax=Hygrophoropsis aurantiaca TaxID=72124 RepID=A0ACB8AMV4_9AGAM|nr:hypothetical protein BJ138DRAFT_1143462 [Hygrophoropsis aurantiaca]
MFSAGQFTESWPFQTVLGQELRAKLRHDDVWRSSAIIPIYAAIVSGFLLSMPLGWHSRTAQMPWTHNTPSMSHPHSYNTPDERNIDCGEDANTEHKPEVIQCEGPFNTRYKFARFIGCLALLGCSLAGVMFEEHEGLSGIHRTFILIGWTQFSLCVAMTYASFLGFMAVISRSQWSKLMSNHLDFLLLAVFGVFVYRNLYPLVTFTKQPSDIDEGWLLWVKIAILTLTAVIIPITSPRQYVPFDPRNPSHTPHPEQTASWLSMLLYTWEDPIVSLACRVPHLSHNHLPPLADQDYSENLIKRSFPHLDPFSGSKQRHIFFGLMKVYRTEYMILAAMIIIYAFASVASPIGINYLLLYLETNGEGAIIRPWVWIVWLFLGPMVGSLAIQWYIFIATRTLVRTEGIITQLVFNHSLRVRMKTELPDDVTNEVSATLSSADQASPAECATPTEGIASGMSGAMLKQRTLGTACPKNNKRVPKPSAGNLVGKINNLVTTDLNNITEGRDFMFIAIYVPLQVGLCIWFLYGILEWAAIVGLLFMILLFPIPGYVAQRIQTVQLRKMDNTDSRVQTVTETMNVLRMIKLFGWENKMNAKITEKREDELVWTWKQKILELINGNLNYVIPLITMLASYTTYTLVMGQNLSASKVFSSMSVFDILREQLHSVFYNIPKIIQAKVSLDRVDSFLVETEMLDSYTQAENGKESIFTQEIAQADAIGFRDAVFTWSNESNGSLTPSKRKFRLHIEEELIFRRGCVNLVVGATGSGKTSMLMALLGEMHFIPLSAMSWFGLPRKDGIAYAAQETWVQNETIRDNILFGAPYDEARYRKVLYQCALERDLTLFEAGDKTEVGEKGLTLSGGQKARITLARAIYSPAKTLLLDDVLAALDVHTSKWIVDKCLAGDLVRNRTVILVTHNVAMTSSIAQFVVSLGSNGRIISQGPVSDATSIDSRILTNSTDEQETVNGEVESIETAETVGVEEESIPETKEDAKLVVAEEILEGHVSWHAFKLYLAGLGGSHGSLFWAVFLCLIVSSHLVTAMQTWFLGYWAAQYEIHPASEINVPYYLVIYALLLLFATHAYSAGFILYYYGSMRASRNIHQKLVQSILGTTLRWLDITPTSRVITRCTQDIRAIDGPFAQGIGMVIEVSLSMLIKIGAIVVVTPVFLIPGVFIGLLGAFIGRIYMKAQLSVKREMSNAKAPVLGHFGAAIAGITSIRAYGAEEAFKQESLVRIDRYTKSARMFFNLNRWVSVRIDAMGAMFSSGLAAYLVYGHSNAHASNIGFSLNMAVGFSSMILWWVRVLNEVEVNGNSLERIDSYINIEQEPKSVEGGQPPAYWPASGDLRAENLCARYSSDGPKVLQDLSFHINSGERVGIVGRTGSGKSSVTLSLLRCIFTEGTVYYDGIPTSSINLEALRSNVTIIPQIPELLTGTLRQNLDPFDQHDDATLNDALRSAGLSAVQDDLDEFRLTLDSLISSGGGNLSVGQRQILALARAMVRGSKILILDEATSAIDYKTDSAIQSSLRNGLHDVTQLIIAHRLQTIIDAHKIMVLDAGKMVEFGTPRELLRNDQGVFRALVDESGDKDLLYSLATG